LTLDHWLEKHPYLQPMGELQTSIESAVAEVLSSTAPIPQWAEYLCDFRDGVPLLQSSIVTIDFTAAAKSLPASAEKLCSKPLLENLARESRGLSVELCRSQDAPHRAIGWLLGVGPFTAVQTGLLQCLGWTMLSRYLAPAVAEFEQWSEDKNWLRPYCPTCGSAPAMAQLIGVDPGRHRFLACGRCRTRWRFRRLGCAFCDNEDDTQLGVIGLEDEGGLRVDYCRACGGYLKTYSAEGSEDVMLADWTSLHLDVLARDRGLNRLTGSLYEL
jgi:FdhE protein